MSKSRGSKTLTNGRSVPKSEHFTKMLRATMEEPAWQELSPVAQALYPWLKLEWKGPQANNNGNISLSVRQAAARLGVSRNTATNAFHDLQAKGFIAVTKPARLGLSGEAKCTSFELTELAMPNHELSHGRKLYREWRKGHDFPVHKTMANNPLGRNLKSKSCHKKEDSTVINFTTISRRTS